MKKWLLASVVCLTAALPALAYWQSRLQVSVAGAAATTTWNPADKGVDLNLSGGNLTVTATIAGYESVRAIASQASGKRFYQYHLDTAIGGELAIVGIGNATAQINDFPGNNNNGIAYDADAGIVWLNGGVLATIQTGGNGDTISIAIDIGATLFWARTNSGNWNNNAGADPAAGTGGINFSTIAAGPYFPMGSVNTLNTAITANFGGGVYSPAAPAGFGNW